MVNVPHLATLDHDARLHALAGVSKVLMHSGCSEENWYWRMVGTHTEIAEDQDGPPFVNTLLGVHA